MEPVLNLKFNNQKLYRPDFQPFFPVIFVSFDTPFNYGGENIANKLNKLLKNSALQW